MSTTTNKSSNSTGSSADRIQQTADAFSTLDAQRVTELNNAAKFLTIDTNALTAEQKRLTAKYGADDPRVLALTARITARQPLAASLKQEITRAGIQPTGYDPTTTGMLAGRVFDNNLQPLAKVTVYVADSDKKPVASLSSCTDANGYYSIPFNSDQAGLFKAHPSYLNVADSTGKNIYTGKTALAATIGQTYYGNIITGNAGCPPPPSPSPSPTPVP